MNKDFKSIIISEEDIKKQVETIGKMIDEKYGKQEILLVGLLKGAYVYTSDIARAIKNPNVGVEFMVASSYKNGSSTGDVKISLDLKTPIDGRKVIIVEDIVDTGKTLSKIKKIFLARGAESVEIAAMCTKPERREEFVHIDYPSFEIPNEIVVGYGLDFNERYRHLPFVAAISDEAFEKYKK